MAAFDLNRLFASRRSQAPEEHAACRDVARAWCGLIADAAALHERLASPIGRARPRSDEDRRQP